VHTNEFLSIETLTSKNINSYFQICSRSGPGVTKQQSNCFFTGIVAVHVGALANKLMGKQTPLFFTSLFQGDFQKYAQAGQLCYGNGQKVGCKQIRKQHRHGNIGINRYDAIGHK
jgi:hypothetical protein